MKQVVQIFFSLLLAGVVMFYLYRDFPFSKVSYTLSNDINWLWIAIGMLMGSAAQIMRALRWQLLLTPIGAKCPLRNLIGAVFTSFALSLLIPRIGEVSRCATLRKTNGISFSKSIGTVVAERIADTLVLLLLICLVFYLQWPTVCTFFPSSATNTSQSVGSDNKIFFLAVIAVSLALIAVCAVWLLRRNEKFRKQCSKFKEGLLSVKHSGHPWLFTGASVLICLFNLLNLWLMFYGFSFTEQLGAGAALLAFCMIAFAMVIPTPNGAGPWHYVVMMSLVLYGIDKSNASTFTLIVHAVHMLTIIILGFIGMLIIRKSK